MHCWSSLHGPSDTLAEEFTAHSDTVNCVCIGRKSGRVLATGGDDRNVNIWTVGQPNVVMVCRGPAPRCL